VVVAASPSTSLALDDSRCVEATAAAAANVVSVSPEAHCDCVAAALGFTLPPPQISLSCCRDAALVLLESSPLVVVGNDSKV